MVGKRRLNNRLGIDTRRGTLPLESRWGTSLFPFCTGKESVEDAPIVPLDFDVLKRHANRDSLNHKRNAANSIGRRSDCHSRNAPPRRNIKSASQTPAAGERCPCLAKETPIKEIE